MASSLAHQESVMLKKLGHSFFTYYLLEGLKGGGGKSVDNEGHVTPHLLGDYIDEQIMSLPPDKRPDQRPLIKTEVSGKIILAEHPEFVKISPSTYNSTLVDISSIIDEGLQYISDGDYANAVTLFDRAIALKPDSYVAFNYKGDAFCKLKRYDEAIECYDVALKIKPDYLDVIKDKGLALDNLKKYDEAIECYNRYLSINSKNAQTWYFKGLAFFHSTNYKEAIKCFDEALRIIPSYAEALKYKGFAQDKAGKLGVEKLIHNSFIKIWGSGGSGDGQFNSPTNIAVDSLGSVYVAELGNGRIQKFDSDGNFLTKWKLELLTQPRGIAVDSSDNVYVADCGFADSVDKRIQKFDSDGNFLTKWGCDGGDAFNVCMLWGISVDSLSNVYVTDSTFQQVQKFDSDGNFLTKWGSEGSGDGQFNLPRDIAVDSLGQRLCSGYGKSADSEV